MFDAVLEREPKAPRQFGRGSVATFLVFSLIVGVVIGTTPDVVTACKILWEYGILITPALFPIVPIGRGLLRFSITAANTEEEIARSLEALAAVRDRCGLP